VRHTRLDPAGVAGLCFWLAFVLVGFAVAYRLGVSDGRAQLPAPERWELVRVPPPGGER
jgi:hypothetical protein